LSNAVGMSASTPTADVLLRCRERSKWAITGPTYGVNVGRNRLRPHNSCTCASRSRHGLDGSIGRLRVRGTVRFIRDPQDRSLPNLLQGQAGRKRVDSHFCLCEAETPAEQSPRRFWRSRLCVEARR
jgi:hypothetical protein